MIIFPTNDLGLAAFLLTKGFELVEVDKSDARRQRFIFEGPNFDSYVEEYYKQNNECRKFYNHLKYLKELIYA